MIKDQEIQKAISGISQRAERQQDFESIISSYVEIGILPQLLNRNNQVLYGRRGTGKTHILKYLISQLKEEKTNVISYIDARILGSSPQYTDTSLELSDRCSALFTDILNELYDALIIHIADNPSSNSEQALDALISFSQTATEQISAGKSIKSRAKSSEGTSSEFGIKADLTSFPSLSLSDKSSKGKENEVEESYSVHEYEKIVFPDLHYYLKKVLDYLNADFYILFDEWATIPIDIQPYLAEFIKRAYFSNPRIVIKIASLEYRSNFTIPLEKKNYIGFELGADISSNLDIDDYYVFDRNPERIVEIFAQILYKHMITILPKNHLVQKHKVYTTEDLISTIFTSADSFQELVRASEGVIRDLINIFSIAFFDSLRQDRNKIDKKTVIESSQQWFERDKSQNLSDKLHDVLKRIIDEVIGSKNARSFLVSRELESNDIIQNLFDSRVIHCIKRGYSDKDNPGIRYNIYTLDYGTYVDLINTSKQPQLELEFSEEADKDPDLVVPYDDKRSIRRIILTEDILENVP